jgi:hypothetical protein
MLPTVAASAVPGMPAARPGRNWSGTPATAALLHYCTVVLPCRLCRDTPPAARRRLPQNRVGRPPRRRTRHLRLLQSERLKLRLRRDESTSTAGCYLLYASSVIFQNRALLTSAVVLLSKYSSVLRQCSTVLLCNILAGLPRDPTHRRSNSCSCFSHVISIAFLSSRTDSRRRLPGPAGCCLGPNAQLLRPDLQWRQLNHSVL